MRKHRYFACLVAVFIIGLFMAGGCSLSAPDNFTQEQRIEYTTLKTLQAAKTFREFALESSGSLYQQGLMEESTKDKIIDVGDKLQLAINGAADALLAYKKSGGLGGDKALQEKLEAYQTLFNEFMEMVSPLVLDTSGKEVS